MKSIKNEFNIPWIEKYRPNNIDDIILDTTNMKRIKYLVNNGMMPNIIIAGASGIGKTTAVICLAKHILKDKYKDDLFELNASDDRKIKIIQESMMMFCKKKINSEYGQKIVLLDEADNLTPKAQQLIANLMENYEKSTRFIITCNNTIEIIDSIQSRCNIIKFQRISREKIKERLLKICELEKIKFEENGIDTIIFGARGDLRNAINSMQAVYLSFGDISLKNVNKICDKPNPVIIKQIIEYCKMKDINNAINKIIELKKSGYSGSDIIISINTFLKKYEEIDDFLRIKYIEELGKTCININKGVDTNLQLYGCLSRICLIN